MSARSSPHLSHRLSCQHLPLSPSVPPLQLQQQRISLSAPTCQGQHLPNQQLHSQITVEHRVTDSQLNLIYTLLQLPINWLLILPIEPLVQELEVSSLQWRDLARAEDDDGSVWWGGPHPTALNTGCARSCWRQYVEAGLELLLVNLQQQISSGLDE